MTSVLVLLLFTHLLTAKWQGADALADDFADTDTPGIVEFTDTEGDHVKLVREGSCVKLYSLDELVEECLKEA